MTKTAIIYARVSTARQADDGLPVESQLEQCHAKAESLGADVVKVFRDDGISGRTNNRPGLNAAFDYCDMHRVTYFICWSTSRFARNRLDAAMNKRLLDRIGVRLVYASQEFGAGDDGWLAEAITEVIDEQYSRQIAKDTRRSMRKNVQDGFWNGGHLPLGYRAIQIGKRRRLEVEPAEVHTVKTIFRWYLDGAGTKEIAVRLNEAGSSKRGRRWDKANVSSVLTSRAVIGQLTFKVGDEEVVSKAHEAIISEEDFMAVQELMKDRSPRNSGGTPRSDAVFSGMLRCGACGDAMTTETATGRGGVRYHYYNCRSFLKGAGCRSRRVAVDQLDDWLLSGILDKIFTPAKLYDLVLEVKRTQGQKARYREQRVRALTTEAADVSRRLTKLYEAIEAGTGLNIADLAPRIRELKARKAAIEEQITMEEGAVEAVIDVSSHDLEEAAALFRAMVEDCADVKRVRTFLQGFVRRAVISGDQVRVEYFPERIAATVNGGSQCDVRWLPDLSTLRTEIISIPSQRGRRAAA